MHLQHHWPGIWNLIQLINRLTVGYPSDWYSKDMYPIPERKVRKGFQNGENRALNTTSCHPNSPLSKATYLLFKKWDLCTKGFVLPFWWKKKKNHLKEMKSGFHLSSLCFYSYLISNLGKITHFLLFQLYSLRAHTANSLWHEAVTCWALPLLVYQT